MSTTNSLGAAGTSTSSSVLPNKFSDLSSDQFVKIMLSELQNQDPLKPTDSASLLKQIGDIRSIQSSVDLSAKLNSLVTQNQLSTAGNLLGQQVSGIDSNGNRVFGIVESISRTSSGPILNLRGGTRVSFANVDQFALAAPPPAPAPNPGPTTPPTTPPGTAVTTPTASLPASRSFR